MRVSIAMATFNGARFLQAQLESLARQTYLPSQLVITDDRSEDGTVAIARRFSKSAPFEVVISVNEQRAGVTGNFDSALSHCNGDLVLPCDQDDVWFDGKVETLVDAARGNPSIGCWMVDAALVDENLRPNGATKLGNIRAAGLPDSWFVMGCCAAFRRELLDFLLPIPKGQPAHDNWLVHFSDLLGTVERLEIPMQFYRRHGRNVSQVSVNRLTPRTIEERLRIGIGEVARRAQANDGIRTELNFLSSAIERMKSRPEQFVALAGDRKAAIEEHALRRSASLRKRIEIRSLPRHRRLRPVLSLARDGGYRESGGIRGAVKDLLVSLPAECER